MRRNELNKRIEINAVSKTSDGFGGFTTTSVNVRTTWAKVEPVRGEYSNGKGKVDSFLFVRFSIRKQDVTLDNFITYRGIDYNIMNIVEQGFKNKFLVIEAQEAGESIATISATPPEIAVNG